MWMLSRSSFETLLWIIQFWRKMAREGAEATGRGQRGVGLVKQEDTAARDEVMREGNKRGDREENMTKSKASGTGKELVSTDSTDCGEKEPPATEETARDEDDDLEEGEIRDGSGSVQQTKIPCSLYLKGSCVKAHKCSFLHSTLSSRGHYQMFDDQHVRRNAAPVAQSGPLSTQGEFFHPYYDRLDDYGSRVDRFGRELINREYPGFSPQRGMSPPTCSLAQECHDPWSRSRRVPVRSRSRSRSSSCNSSRSSFCYRSRSSSSHSSRSNSRHRSRSSSSHSSRSSSRHSSRSCSSHSSRSSSCDRSRSSSSHRSVLDTIKISSRSPSPTGKTESHHKSLVHLETEAEPDKNQQELKGMSRTVRQDKTVKAEELNRKRRAELTPEHDFPTKRKSLSEPNTGHSEVKLLSPATEARQQRKPSELSCPSRPASASSSILPSTPTSITAESATDPSSSYPDSGVLSLRGLYTSGADSGSSSSQSVVRFSLVNCQGSNNTGDRPSKKQPNQSSGEGGCLAKPNVQYQNGKPTKEELLRRLHEVEAKIAKKKATDSSSLYPDSGVLSSRGLHSSGTDSGSSSLQSVVQFSLVNRQGSKNMGDRPSKQQPKQSSGEGVCLAKPNVQYQNGKPTKEELLRRLHEVEAKIAKKKAQKGL
ncbi:uncharacterized protein LOC143285698 [Babylonia areolata]|uniref:uncharacterized protein LOC143285698 n=1 Tax=Babylonia areolata TaxID=304850 RepID=UPI003FCFCF6A